MFIVYTYIGPMCVCVCVCVCVCGLGYYKPKQHESSFDKVLLMKHAALK